MINFKLQNVQSEDLSLILELNQSELPHVSQLSMSELERLSEESIYFRKAVDGSKIAGFVLAFDEKASYESLNFLWFKKNYRDFLYIDRIVVSAAYRRKGVGRLLYEDVDRAALSRKLSWITCEVNILPPNPESMQYHQALGFQAVGEQETEGGKKRVCLLAKRNAILT